MSDITHKTVVYRKFNRVSGDWPEYTLENLLNMALSQKLPDGNLVKDEWTSRRFNLPGSETQFFFSHALSYDTQTLFGMLCLYSPDEFQAIIRQEGDSKDDINSVLEQIEIAEREPPEGENYLKGHAYFLIKGDHVFVVQHMAVRTSSLENYLYRLLDARQLLPRDGKFELQALLNVSDVGGEIGDYKAVEIGGVPTNGWETASPQEVSPESQGSSAHLLSLGRERAKGGMGRRILEDLFGSMRADRILHSVPDGAELEVDVKFGFKSRSRKLDRAALSEIASAARDLPEGQVRAVGKDGKVTGKDLRLQTSMPFQRLRPNGSLLDLQDTKTQLVRVYTRFVEDGKIAP